jgi:glyoxylase-like metal-dependent hydrolase (beta-lactamase superfamily II)
VIALGELRVHIVPDGGFALDGGTIFGVVPRTLWEKTDPPDDRNRVSLGLNVALVETAGQRVLIDTGMGDKWNDVERDRYRLDRSSSLLAALAALGVRPEDIDVVINTHLHFDHAGGNTRIVDGRPVATFPKARYVVQMGEWEDATRPHERSRGSYREADFVPLAESRQFAPVQGEAEVAPGVRVVPTGGHTAYHQMVVVEGGGERLVIPSDVLPTASHIPLPYVTAYDLFPVGTLEAKRRLLHDAAENGWQVLFYHDARRPVGRIAKAKDRYVYAEVKA